MSEPFLPAGIGGDEHARLREAINRHAGALMASLDAAMALRQAPAEAKRARHRARGHLSDAALSAMLAAELSVKASAPDDAGVV